MNSEGVELSDKKFEIDQIESCFRKEDSSTRNCVRIVSRDIIKLKKDKKKNEFFTKKWILSILIAFAAVIGLALTLYFVLSADKEVLQDLQIQDLHNKIKSILQSDVDMPLVELRFDEHSTYSYHSETELCYSTTVDQGTKNEFCHSEKKESQLYVISNETEFHMSLLLTNFQVERNGTVDEVLNCSMTELYNEEEQETSDEEEEEGEFDFEEAESKLEGSGLEVENETEFEMMDQAFKNNCFLFNFTVSHSGQLLKVTQRSTLNERKDVYDIYLSLVQEFFPSINSLVYSSGTKEEYFELGQVRPQYNLSLAKEYLILNKKFNQDDLVAQPNNSNIQFQMNQVSKFNALNATLITSQLVGNGTIKQTPQKSDPHSESTVESNGQETSICLQSSTFLTKVKSFDMERINLEFQIKKFESEMETLTWESAVRNNKQGNFSYDDVKNHEADQQSSKLRHLSVDEDKIELTLKIAEFEVAGFEIGVHLSLLLEPTEDRATFAVKLKSKIFSMTIYEMEEKTNMVDIVYNFIQYSENLINNVKDLMSQYETEIKSYADGIENSMKKIETLVGTKFDRVTLLKSFLEPIREKLKEKLQVICSYVESHPVINSLDAEFFENLENSFHSFVLYLSKNPKIYLNLQINLS